MAKLDWKTLGNTNPQGKERVYFSCHPKDLKEFFSPICQDIFKMQNCTIWYNQAPEHIWNEEEMELELGRMQLFIIPVTSRFLFEKNDSRNREFPFAVEHHIPILPLMQEQGLEENFNRICGDFQSLDKNAIERDPTALPYEQRLKRFLSSILLGDKRVEKVRAAFYDYIFLSYRKMDRMYAQKLMRLIHQNDFCRDIAIWYDEFLVPGERFNRAIANAIEKSGLFVMVVTPNLVNEINYVMTKEYPYAMNVDKEILPVEMQITDLKTLHKNFDDVPEVIDACDEPVPALSEALIERFGQPDVWGKNNDPEHLFLIGLAYLNGIDVEINYGFARESFEMAHESGYIEATKQLSVMYATGHGVDYDIYTAAEYELVVLKRMQESQNSLQDKRRLVNEFLDMAEICLSGKKEQIEPSPGKLFSIRDAIGYYQAAVLLSEKIVVDSESNEIDIRLLRRILGKLCRLLSSGGREVWSNISDKVAIAYCKKWIHFSNVLGKKSDSFEEFWHLRESNYNLLREMNYNSPEYETVLTVTIDAAITASQHNDAMPGDLSRLIDILYYCGVCFYVHVSQLEKASRCLHSCYIALQRYKELRPENIRRDDMYEFQLGLISHKSIEIIYMLISQENISDIGSFIGELINDVIECYDQDDIAMREILVPGLKKLLNDYK